MTVKTSTELGSSPSGKQKDAVEVGAGVLRGASSELLGGCDFEVISHTAACSMPLPWSGVGCIGFACGQLVDPSLGNVSVDGIAGICAQATRMLVWSIAVRETPCETLGNGGNSP